MLLSLSSSTQAECLNREDEEKRILAFQGAWINRFEFSMFEPRIKPPYTNIHPTSRLRQHIVHVSSRPAFLQICYKVILWPPFIAEIPSQPKSNPGLLAEDKSNKAISPCIEVHSLCRVRVAFIYPQEVLDNFKTPALSVLGEDGCHPWTKKIWGIHHRKSFWHCRTKASEKLALIIEGTQ